MNVKMCVVRLLLFVAMLLSMVLPSVVLAEETYITQAQFLQDTFADKQPEAKTFWISKPQKAAAEKILQHPLSMLRVRYWQEGQKTAWILHEIGKEKPITVGVAITGKQIESVNILVFRESRGWEIKYPAFTSQFAGLALQQDLRLDKTVDGVTGATLSVAAVQRTARLALYFAGQVVP